MIEKHVTSLEISKRLRELGVKQESIFCYVDTRKSWKEYNCQKINGKFEFIPFEGIDQGCSECELIFNDLGKPYPNAGYNLTQPLSAFLASELGEMLPKAQNGFVLQISPIHSKWAIGYGRLERKGDTLADAMGKMLIYLIENGYYETRK